LELYRGWEREFRKVGAEVREIKTTLDEIQLCDEESCEELSSLANNLVDKLKELKELREKYPLVWEGKKYERRSD
jgi:hypothetical protein